MGQDNATTLEQYMEGVPDVNTLGYIGWYSLPDPHMTREQLVGLAKAASMSEEHLPGPPRVADAFRRATRYTDKLKKKPQAVAGSSRMYTFMLRPVSSTREETEVHLVLELLDKQGKHLEHEEVARIILNKKTDFLKTELMPAWTNGHITYGPLVDAELAEFRAEFAQAKKEVEPQNIRKTIRDELWEMNALNVRSKGGVYFIPVGNKDRLVALETWVNSLGASLHTLPLPDTGKQKDMVKAAFESDVHGQAHEMIEQLGNLTSSGKKIPPSVWNRYKTRLNDLTKRTKQYSDLVEEEMGKAGTELIMLHEKIFAILENDQVSEGRS